MHDADLQLKLTVIFYNNVWNIWDILYHVLILRVLYFTNDIKLYKFVKLNMRIIYNVPNTWRTCYCKNVHDKRRQYDVASSYGWAVWGVVVSTRWWLLVDHCVLRNWDRILVRAVKGLISRAGMVSICPFFNTVTKRR